MNTRTQTIPAVRGHTHTVILLHDDDSSARELASSLQSCLTGLPAVTVPQAFPHIRWVFPQAAVLPSTMRTRRPLAQWFETPSRWAAENGYDDDEECGNEEETHPHPGLTASVAAILALVDEETTRLRHRDDGLILGGVGRGCATAAHALLQNGRALGGFFGVGGWLPSQREVVDVACRSSSEWAPRRKLWAVRGLCPMGDGRFFRMPGRGRRLPGDATPVMLARREGDCVEDGERRSDLMGVLMGLGFRVAWRTGGPRGVDDVVAFLERVAAVVGKERGGQEGWGGEWW